MRDLAKCSFPRWAPVCPGKRATSQPSRFGTLNLLTPKRMGTSLAGDGNLRILASVPALRAPISVALTSPFF